MKLPIKVLCSGLVCSAFLLSCSRNTDPVDPVISTITITSISPTHGPGNTIDTIIVSISTRSL